VDVTGDLIDLPIRALLESLASDDPAPASGSTAALVVAMAAALVIKVARASGDWKDQGAVCAQADRLLRRTMPLAQSDADAYEEALAVLRLPERLEPEVRDMAIGQVFARAAEIPLVIAEAGADVACLAEAVVERGTTERRGDALAAALLAGAATRAAANLVAVNLVVTPQDERVLRALAVAEVAEAAVRNALDAAAT
jgi:methenyltetrahydrofolate cyclohydrolase